MDWYRTTNVAARAEKAESLAPQPARRNWELPQARCSAAAQQRSEWGARCVIEHGFCDVCYRSPAWRGYTPPAYGSSTAAAPAASPSTAPVSRLLIPARARCRRRCLSPAHADSVNKSVYNSIVWFHVLIDPHTSQLNQNVKPNNC